MQQNIYYLPGRGGRLNTGLGKALEERGLNVFGREISGDFQQLSFTDQVNAVASDLTNYFCREDSLVVANSFGAYFFLHAQARILPLKGKILLLSPIVGESSREETLANFIPPRADELQKALMGGDYPAPRSIEIHVGSEDWQSCPANVLKIASSIGANLNIVNGGGHELGKDYVGRVLNHWLES
jgi:hypothetical protein